MKEIKANKLGRRNVSVREWTYTACGDLDRTNYIVSLTCGLVCQYNL